MGRLVYRDMYLLWLISIRLLPHFQCVLQHPSLVLICIFNLLPKYDLVDTEFCDLTCKSIIVEEHVVCLQRGTHVGYLVLWEDLADLWRTERSHDEGRANNIDGDILIS